MSPRAAENIRAPSQPTMRAAVTHSSELRQQVTLPQGGTQSSGGADVTSQMRAQRSDTMFRRPGVIVAVTGVRLPCALP